MRAFYCLQEVLDNRWPLDSQHYLDQFDNKVAPLIAPVMAMEEARSRMNKTLAGCWGGRGQASTTLQPKRKSDRTKIKGQMAAEKMIHGAKRQRVIQPTSEDATSFKAAGRLVAQVSARKMLETMRVDYMENSAGELSGWARGCIDVLAWPTHQWMDASGKRVVGKKTSWAAGVVDIARVISDMREGMPCGWSIKIEYTSAV